MRIATITNWAYGATVCLTIASGVVMVMASNADGIERAAVAQRDMLDQLSFELENDLAELTDQARLSTLSEDPSHKMAYQRTLESLGTVEQRLARLKNQGAGEVELHSLREGLRWAETLQDEQQAAIDAASKGDQTRARAIVFGPEYERELERVHFLMGRFRYMLDQRSDDAVAKANAASQRLRSVSEIMVAITALLFLFVLGFILKRRILRPVVSLSDVVNRLADQDYTVEPPHLSQIDEIGDMAQAIAIFRENGIERLRLEKERDADRTVRDLLSRMTQRLQGCESVQDLYQVVHVFAPQIAPHLSGRLYVLSQRMPRMMICAATWGTPSGSDIDFSADDCWALRRGQAHSPSTQQVDVPCKHLPEEVAEATVCVPLTAQGETIGLLVLENLSGPHRPDPSQRIYIALMSETIGLALANLNLREALHEKALYDSLTGLRNRHELASTVRRMAARATVTGAPLGCLMLDIDHFKRLNDQFGHDAGDMVIRAVAASFASVVRDDGVAFRYGGEEFLMLLPGLGEEQALERARLVQTRIGEIDLFHDGEPIGPITASIGLAIYPDHGAAEALIATADAALLRAKKQGRNCIVTASVRQT